MKLSLTVLGSGRMAGKTIAISGPEFLIGRDPLCQLRPASPLVSKRHCALLIRSNKVFVRDFGSSNGTLVNDRRIEGECELTNDDRLTVGPLTFRVGIEGKPLVDQPTPLPDFRALRSSAGTDEDAIAAMLMSLDRMDSKGDLEISSPSTMELDLPSADTQSAISEPNKKATAKSPKEVPGSGDTGAAAKAILKKYKHPHRRTPPVG